MYVRNCNGVGPMLADGCACFAEIARYHEGAIRLSNA